MSQQRASIAVVTHYPPVNENSRKGNGLVGEGLSALERRRLEQELGPGGDHDVRYRFDLPPVTQQVLAWMRLLARRQRGELLSQVESAGNNPGAWREHLGVQRSEGNLCLSGC